MESESVCMLRLKRVKFLNESTLGSLYVNGVYFGDILEDKYRNLAFEQKVAGETAIPFGTYKGIVSMSQRFGKMLPLLLDVPHFDGIRIHSGNNALHTRGCLLIGRRSTSDNLYDSTRLMARLMAVLSSYESFIIHIE